MKELPVKGQFMERRHFMGEGTQLANRMAGYSLRVHSRGIVNKISFVGLFVVLGFFFVLTLVVKDVLVMFAGQSALINKQRHNDLYVDHHIKDD